MGIQSSKSHEISSRRDFEVNMRRTLNTLPFSSVIGGPEHLVIMQFHQQM